MVDDIWSGSRIKNLMEKNATGVRNDKRSGCGRKEGDA